MSKFFELASAKFSAFGTTDALDIIFLSIIIFFTYKFARKRRAFPIFLGVIAFWVVERGSEALGFLALNSVLKPFTLPGVLMLIIIFQSDIRAYLEKIGNFFIKMFRLLRAGINPFSKEYEINSVKNAVMRLSASKSGALIVLERNTGVGDIVQNGIKLDALISTELICNIFFAPAPLHDGAIIISGRRITAAGCFLPNYSDSEINSGFGSRHRAAIGMSRTSDAGVIVVSEEDGKISYAFEGQLERGIDEEKLLRILGQYYSAKKKKSNTKNKKKRA